MVNPLRKLVKNRHKKSDIEIMEDDIYKYLFETNNAYEALGFTKYKKLLKIKLSVTYPDIISNIDIDSLSLKLINRYKGVGIVLSINNNENELLMKKKIFKSLSDYMELVEECGYGELLEKVKSKLTNKHTSSTLEPTVLTNETISLMLEKRIIKIDDDSVRYRFIYR